MRLLRRRESDPGALPSVAVITLVRDEAAMLPRWLAHYSAHVGHRHLVVVDDNTADGSTDGLPCSVIRLPEDRPDQWERMRVRLASDLAAALLHTYDYVVFADADEFLVPDPRRHDSLRHFLAARPEVDVVAGMALNLVQHPAEAPIDPARPVTEQREYAAFVPLMCKPQVKRVPAPWRKGIHGVLAPFAVDPELYLLHLKFHDRAALAASAESRRRTVASGGHAGGTSWAMEAEELVGLVDELTVGVDTDAVPVFDPGSVDLAGAVHREGEMWRTTRQGQVAAMREQPLVRLPDHLRGTV